MSVVCQKYDWKEIFLGKNLTTANKLWSLYPSGPLFSILGACFVFVVSVVVAAVCHFSFLSYGFTHSKSQRSNVQRRLPCIAVGTKCIASLSSSTTSYDDDGTRRSGKRKQFGCRPPPPTSMYHHYDHEPRTPVIEATREIEFDS